MGEHDEPPAGWVPFDEAVEQIQQFTGTLAINRRLVEALRRSSPDRAMEDALVALIFAVQEQLDAPTLELVQYLLWEYAPVAGLFPAVDRTYRLDGLTFRLARDDEGRLVLMTKSEGWDQDE